MRKFFLPAVAFFVLPHLSLCQSGLIGQNIPAYTNDDCGGSHPASLANSAKSGDVWQSCNTPSTDNPAWLAHDLSKVPTANRSKVLLFWTNDVFTAIYDHRVSGPYYKNEDVGYDNVGSYYLQANVAPGGTLPASGWVTLPGTTVSHNTYHSRQHVLNLAGYNWVRFVATASDGTKDNMGVALHMDLYDASQGLADDWIFYGDSITQGSMDHKPKTCSLGSGSFSELIHAHKPQSLPIQESGGIGGLLSADGAAHIQEWLKLFPGKYVVLSYGANDAWNCVEPEIFRKNYQVMIDAALAAGKTVVIPTSITWSSKIANIQKCGPVINQELQNLFKAYPQIIHGPDFWPYFKNHPGLLSQDGVHPSEPEGMFAYRKMWADAMLAVVYSNASKPGAR